MLGSFDEGSGTGEPLGFTPGPSCTPFGAIPESPFGEIPGPRRTPLGAIDEG